MTDTSATRAIRAKLRMTQQQLAQVLGVHGLTVSKWERGLLTPTPYCSALLKAFEVAVSKQPDIGEVAINALFTQGAASALYELLRVGR